MPADVVYSVPQATVRRARRRSLGFFFLFGLPLIVLYSWLSFLSAGRGNAWGIPGDMLLLALLVVPFMLIFLEGAKKNTFAIRTDGIQPPSRPIAKFLRREDYRIPYGDVAGIELEEDTSEAHEPGAHPFTFFFTLRNGKRFFINPMGGFTPLGRYVKTEKGIVHVYRLLKIVMEEVNAPANQAKAGRGEDVVIPAERFD